MDFSYWGQVYLIRIDFLTAEGAEGAEVEKRERFEICYKLWAYIAFHAIEFFMGMID